VSCHRRPREETWLAWLVTATLALCAGFAAVPVAAAGNRPAAAPVAGAAATSDAATLDLAAGAGFGAAPGGGASVRAGLYGATGLHHGAPGRLGPASALRRAAISTPTTVAAGRHSGLAGRSGLSRAPPRA
jgi:hypothetical protein